MRSAILLSLLLHLLFQISGAQDSSSQAAAASITPTPSVSVSVTPQMSASSVSSFFSALATTAPQQPGSGPSAGDAGSAAGSEAGDTDAGASGSDTGSISISRGAIIAIIVVAVSVCLFGATSAILYYLAKKRDWKVRESIRKSARRVATALTPRRTTFPKDVYKKRGSARGLTKIDEVPNTPRNRSADVEKGISEINSFEMAQPPKESRWARKLGR